MYSNKQRQQKQKQLRRLSKGYYSLFVSVLFLDVTLLVPNEAYYIVKYNNNGRLNNNRNNNNNYKLSNVWGIVTRTTTTTSSSSSSYSSIRAQQQRIDNDSTSNAAGNTSSRIRNVKFISPLLEYGYKPAVEEYIAIKQHQQQVQQEVSKNHGTNTITSTLPKPIHHQLKPILLFLPGFDGTILSPFLQFPEIQTTFDLRCMVVGTNDRSTYDELHTTVINYLYNEIHGNTITNEEEEKDDDDDEQQQQQGITNISIINNVNDSLTSNFGNVTDSIAPSVQGAVAAICNNVNGTTDDNTNTQNATNPWLDIVQGTTSFFNTIVTIVTIATSSLNTIPTTNNNNNNNNNNQNNNNNRINNNNRPVYIVGESFGGILASDVVLTILDNNTNNTTTNKATTTTKQQQQQQQQISINIQGLILINSATCYDRSRLAVDGPKVTTMPNWLYPFGLLSLVPLFIDNYSIRQLVLIIQGKALPSVIDNEIREAYLGRFALSLPFTIPLITQDILRWRLTEWLMNGCDKLALNNRLSKLRTNHKTLRTLIIAGEDDRCLPSIAEAQRLSVVLPNSVVHIVPGAGHCSTCGSRIDLAALLRKRYPELNGRNIDFNKKKKDLITSITISTTNNNNNTILPRTSMKIGAASNSGVLFGMEPRYDNKTIGLSPLLYWNDKYFKKYIPDL